MIRPALVSEVRRVTEFMKAFEQASASIKVDVDYSVKRYEDFISTGRGQMLMLLNEHDELQGSKLSFSALLPKRTSLAPRL